MFIEVADANNDVLGAGNEGHTPHQHWPTSHPSLQVLVLHEYVLFGWLNNISL